MIDKVKGFGLVFACLGLIAYLVTNDPIVLPNTIGSAVLFGVTVLLDAVLPPAREDR